MTTENDKTTSTSATGRLRERVMKWVAYCTGGCWRDTRRNWRVNTVKTLNLTVRSIFDSDLQSVACAMTYRTVLALVPMLAMAFAICRGFGFENLLTEQLYNYFPSQRKVLATVMRFVDSYLAQASEGVFVGVGVVFLLWTVISLLSNVEDSFNKIWNVRHGRTIWRQATDYLGMMLVLPVLIICSSGITVILDTTLKKLLPFEAMTPALTVMFELVSLGLIVVFFTVSYMLIPNTKVRFVNALFSGTLVAVAYTVLQWLFVTGQMYVSKYNAIYGSFSFLPLFLIWLQLVWLFTYIGAVVCYASQNFSRFNYQADIEGMSVDYGLRLTLAVAAITAARYARGEAPLTPQQVADDCQLPLGAVERCYATLLRDGLVVEVSGADGHPDGTVVPARGMSDMTVGQVAGILVKHGQSGFITGFDTGFGRLTKLMESMTGAMLAEGDQVKITSLAENTEDMIAADGDSQQKSQ